MRLKSSIILPIASLLILFFFGCIPAKETESLVLEISSASFDPSDIPPKIVFPAEGGSAYIDFNSQEVWTATTDADWCTLSLSGGTPGRIHLQLTAIANDRAEERKGRMVIATRNASVVVELALSPMHEGEVE